jgi:phytanoyl-CoA hydroxylase
MEKKMTNIKTDFDKQGYIAIKNFLDAAELYELKAEVQRFIKEVVPNIPAEQVYYEDKSKTDTLKQVQKLYDYDDYFLKLAQSSKVLKLAQGVLGGEVELKNMQYFNKIPHSGKGTPPHQDGYYFKIKPQQAITMWLSLGYADAENGAVCYIPGSHIQGMRPHSTTKTLGFSQGISDWSSSDDDNEVQMIAEPGDILVHHSLTVHRANNNESDRNRKSIGFIFYRKDVQEDEEAHAMYKKELNSRLEKEEKI